MVDEHAATDLKLFIDNESALHGQMTSIRKNLATKKVRPKNPYTHDLAVKLFGYLVEAGAKKYAKEFGGTWHKLFDVPTRKVVAEALTDDFEREFELGNYDQLLPHKYKVEMLGEPKKKRPSKAKKLAAEIAQALSGTTSTRSPHQAWDVRLGEDVIDTVFYSPDVNADEVRRGLSNHDGYDPRITVTRVRKRARPGQRVGGQ